MVDMLILGNLELIFEMLNDAFHKNNMSHKIQGVQK